MSENKGYLADAMEENTSWDIANNVD